MQFQSGSLSHVNNHNSSCSVPLEMADAYNAMYQWSDNCGTRIVAAVGTDAEQEQNLT